MKKNFFDYCTEHNYATLLSEWDSTANENLTPHDVSSCSHKEIWWKCEKGHSWKAKVYNRINSKSCPYCAGKFVIPGENDLASRYPDLITQWHPDKNGNITPDQIAARSPQKIWWRCEKGHSWYAQVKSRTYGANCPVCTNRMVLPGENDLKTTHPELAAQWHPTKNENISPENITAGSDKTVWWQCKNGHSWKASIASRAAGRGCPVCSGKKVIPGENDLLTAFPAIAAQWHQTKNYPQQPNMVSPFSNRKAWWSCELGHVYQAIIASRTRKNTGCPFCAGMKVLAGFNDLETVHPKIAAQWHPSLNDKLTPQMVTRGSSKKVWWQCDEGHVWKAKVSSRTCKKKHGCPVCAGKVKGIKQVTTIL